MTNVLTVALERQRELRDEIAQIDEFIRLAETLLRNAKTRADERPGLAPELCRDLPETVAAEPAPEPVSDEPAERQDSAAPDEPAPAAADAGLRKFPWTGMQPAVRRSGSDEPAGPTRRNVFRRDMTAAG